MTKTDLAVIILAAGAGTRMKSSTTKVMHKIAGLPMIGHVLAKAAALSPAKCIVVIGDHAPEVGDYARAYAQINEIAIQSPPKGTAHAVAQGMPALAGFTGPVLILYADTPLVSAATMSALAAKVSAGNAVAVLGFKPDEAGAYGRLKLDDDGGLAAIVEAKDASRDELEIELCNSGVMAIDGAFLHARLNDIGNDNAKREYYLTDIVALARKDGRRASVIEAAETEVLGVNSRTELAVAEGLFQQSQRRAAMEAGATLIDPQTVYFSYDTKIGSDVLIEPGVVFGPAVQIGNNVVVKAYSHLEGVTIKAGASIGPFTRLRPGTVIGPDAKIGNFVELKKAEIGSGAKVSHLSYIGDAAIGAEANIGAGTITCNYDGYSKHQTIIGERAFVGSNSSLVAPVRIGDGAYIGSGSVITKPVEPNDLAVARGRQSAIKGWAARFRKANGDDT